MDLALTYLGSVISKVSLLSGKIRTFDSISKPLSCQSSVILCISDWFIGNEEEIALGSGMVL